MENKKKIHVGFLTERMLRGFGVDLIIDRVARELVDGGFDVTVFCINADGTFENDKYKIVQIQSSLHHNPIKTEWSAIKALKRLNCEDDIDIWIAETYPFFIATRIMNKPVIVVDPGVVLTKGLHFIRRMIFVYIKFTQAEYRIMSLMCKRKGFIISRYDILENSELFNSDEHSGSIAVIINRIRNKIEDDPKHPQYLTTIRGMGYKLVE